MKKLAQFTNYTHVGLSKAVSFTPFPSRKSDPKQESQPEAVTTSFRLR